MFITNTCWLSNGDGMRNWTNDMAIMIVDPPWDSGLWPRIDGVPSAIVFCDGQRIGDVVSRYGAPAWNFVWDCGSCWYTPNRPLKKHKLALWYGDVTTYRDIWRSGINASSRIVKNTRGEHEYHADPRGKRLIDVYAHPISKKRPSGFGHEKPIEWIDALITNCGATCTTVIDPFAGSGAVAIAAMRSGKFYAGCEIDHGRWRDAAQRIAALRQDVVAPMQLLLGDGL